MKIEGEKVKKDYSYEEMATLVIEMWPKVAMVPDELEVLDALKKHVQEDATVSLLPLCAAVELLIRSIHGDFYTDWEQLIVATRALPILLKSDTMSVVDQLWLKFKNRQLDAEETDQLYDAVLKPGPKLAWDEHAFRYVSEKITQCCIAPSMKMAQWKKGQGVRKQEKMLEQQRLQHQSPLPLQIARVEGVETTDIEHIDYKLDVLKIVFESGYLGSLKPARYLAPFTTNKQPLVLHDPRSLMKLREVSKRARTWVDDLLASIGLQDAVVRARTVHFQIAKRRLLLVECWTEIVSVIEDLTKAYPLDEHDYICLGGSPAPIMIAMECLEPSASIFHLPLSGIKGGVEQWLKDIGPIWKQYKQAICEHFSRYLPPLGRIRGNKIVVIDYTSTGTALAIGMKLVRYYYEELANMGPSSDVAVPEVLGFALLTSFNPNPTLLSGTVTCNLRKSPLGVALEKQTLKGSGLRGLEKMEFSSLRTTVDRVPDTRLDLAGLMRIFAQIQKQLKHDRNL
jgi:hypothetical protein